MTNLTAKARTRLRRASRVRQLVSGNAQRPRLAVHISNLHVTAQVVDDSSQRTLAYVTTVGRKLDGPMTNKAKWVGEEIAQRAVKAKIKKVVFDRGGSQYHGRVKALAEAARAGGLEF